MKQTILLSIVALLFLCTNADAQVLGSPDIIRMTQAKNRIAEGDYQGALNIYLQLYTAHGTNPLLNYRIAECYVVLQEGKDALAYVDKARELDASVDKDLEYIAAMAYRLVGKQPDALARLEVYLKQEKLKKEDIEKAEALRTMCNNTIDLMSKPVNVKISNAGPNINTPDHHDYHPSITADGKLMVFTSRRAADDFTAKDPYDEEYFEKVFITYWSDSLGDWAPAVPIPGSINAKGRHDAATSISADGKQVFLYRNENGGDIFVSKTRNAKAAADAIQNESPDVARFLSMNKWGNPLSLGKPVNSSYWESCGTISADANTLYFVSERPKGQGSGDIWMSKRLTGTTWAAPVNLEGINTVEDEKSVFMHPDGKTIFFSSQGHRNMGGYDIFRSVLGKDGRWSEPENLGYPINTTGDEFDFVMTTDGKTAYYCSSAEGSQKYDIMKIDLSNYNVLNPGGLAAEKSGLSIVRGTVSNAAGNGVSTKVVFKEANGGQLAGETESDEDGSYFMALPGDKEYEIVVNAQAYKEYRHRMKLSLGADGSTKTIEHSFTLQGK
jgi:Tol biopolymer transport system component